MSKTNIQISDEKIKELISVGYETDELDYKIIFNNESKKSFLGLGMDAAAFANTTGGYIIFGVSDGDFKPIGIADDFHVDTAQIQQLFDEYFKPPIRFVYAERFLDIDGSRKKFACISIDQSNEIIIASKQGNVTTESNKNKCLFRPGDVFIRKSGMTERANSDSMRLLVSRVANNNVNNRLNTINISSNEASDLQLRRMHNLERPDYREFIGRQKYIDDILAKLGQRFFVISIDGIGGVGKTALASEVSRRCLDQQLFDAIVWVSAKTKRLMLTGIDDIVPSLTSYENLINAILEVLGYKTSISEPIQIRSKKVKELLKQAKCLLVIDNLETVEDKQIFDFIINLPEPSKALITSRKRLGEVERIIKLKGMSFEEAKQLMQMDAQDKNVEVLSQFSDQLLRDIYRVTGGIPLAIRWVIGLISLGHDAKWVCNKVGKKDSPVLEFCFQEIFNNLLSQSAKKILCIMPIFERNPARQELKFVSMMNEEKFEKAIGELLTLSLINRDVKPDERKILTTYYSILPLTLSFAQSKLSDDRGLEVSARKRLGAYLQRQEKQTEALEQYGYALERIGATTENGKVAALQAQLAFAAYQRGNYSEAVSLFKQAIKVDPNLSYTYQLWAMIERQEGNIGKADELYNEAARFNPTNPIIWRSWAMMKKDVGDLNGSEKLLIQFLKYRPNDKASIHSLAVVKSVKGNYKEADELFERTYTAKPRNFRDITHNLYVFSARAENLRKWGETEERKQLLESAKNKFQKGLELIERGLKKDSREWNLIRNGIRLHRSLARVESKLGEFEEANANYKRAIFYRPRNDKQRKHNSEVYYSFALNYSKMKRVQEAISMCNESIRYAYNKRALELKRALTS